MTMSDPIADMLTRIRNANTADETWIPKEYASKSSNSPFTGEELTGKVKYTICGGNIVYSDIK